MKILIAYAGKTGTTQKCAEILAEKLPGSITADLSTQAPDIKEFDTVIVGGSIRMGRLHKKAKAFIDANAAILVGKKTAYFICCGFAENAEAQFAANFSKELLEHAACYSCFGGEMNMEKLHGFDKFIAGMVTKAGADKKTEPPEIIYENIGKLADCIKAEETGKAV